MANSLHQKETTRLEAQVLGLQNCLCAIEQEKQMSQERLHKVTSVLSQV